MKLSENCKKAIKGLCVGMNDEWYRPFQAISKFGEIEPYLVRRTVRLLARKGLAEYAKGLCSDDGEFRGAGYRLTSEGWVVAKDLGFTSD